ncbi:hypothetical protein B0T17DRAFT_508323 [Bombardia bombarda]|uniref:Uncharacterized protein n=1 Tax=Bombardia bombarda TaxID=252184 RepID=A0AA40C529_9PEZI|nr:hypothetical protein B0T17DRAFT_508323 [Bombardia bombarda]
MKFTIAAVLALAAMASAYVIEDRNVAPIERRQEVQNQVQVEVPAMSDANGNIIPFDTAKVAAITKRQEIQDQVPPRRPPCQTPTATSFPLTLPTSIKTLSPRASELSVCLYATHLDTFGVDGG